METKIQAGTVRKLPAPRKVPMTLTQALAARRSARDYSAKPIDADALSYILWAGAGKTGEGKRTVPSAMGRCEIRLYVLAADGVWRYEEDDHALVCVNTADMRAASTLDQDFVAVAPVTILCAADKARSKDIGRYLDYDAGCVGMAVQLAVTALGLASVIRGSFDPAKMTEALGTDAALAEPKMCVTVGLAQ